MRPFNNHRTVFINSMKSTLRLEQLRNRYLHKLLSDKSIDDRTRLFAKAKSIFDQLRRKGSVQKSR